MASRRASSARAAVDHSFEELYRGHHRDVFRVVLRDLGNVHDAEDVTQAAFLDAYRAVLRGSEPQSPRAWLLAIAENVRRRRFRTAQRRPREEPLGPELPPATELPDDLAQALALALAALPPDQRRVFILREVAGLSYDEIAERVGATVASIQMLLFRARRSLRVQLDPPTVARRRAGLLVPFPGWLTASFSRLETAIVAPRAAGAIGATVMTVVGAGVVVGPPPVVATPKPQPLISPAPVPAAPQLSSRAVRPTKSEPGIAAVMRRASLTAPRPRSVPLQEPVSVAAEPAEAPVSAPAQTPASAPDAAVTPASEPGTVPVSVPVHAQGPAPALPELVRPGLPLPLENVEVPGPLELPSPPPPSTAQIEEAAGAAGAAGASAPPLPVPSLPLEPLPPA